MIRKLIPIVVIITMTWLFKAQIRTFYLKVNLSQSRKAVEIKKVKNLIIGNSLVAHSCIYSKANLFEKVSFRGEIIRGIHWHLKNTKKNNFKNIFIWIGLNDILNGHSNKEIYNDYRSLLNAASEYGEKIIIINIPEINLTNEGLFVNNASSNLTINQFNNFLKAEARNRKILLLDLQKINKSQEIHSKDGIHLNCQFAKLISQTIEQNVENRIEN